jgi:TIR domain/Effector-associated domain 2
MVNIFLCHSSDDKPKVRELYHRLIKDGFRVWLDEVSLLPGQDWRNEIEIAIEKTDVIIVCLSINSVTKEGFVQREIRIALDLAEEKSEGSIFIIPVCFEDCEVPRSLRKLQFLNYNEGSNYPSLLAALNLKASQLGRAEASKVNLAMVSGDKVSPQAGFSSGNLENITNNQTRELIKKLLDCSFVLDPAEFDLVLNALPQNIRVKLKRHPAPSVQIENLVQICRNYEGSLANLLEIVFEREQGSKAQKALETFVLQIKKE